MASGDFVSDLQEFFSIEEIKAQVGYEANNPLHEDNYKRIFGHYHLPEGKEVECCVRKDNGNLCKHQHRHGWVARLKNDTVTILGGDCAANKFIANSSLARDLTKAKNALEFIEKRDRAKRLLLDRDDLLAELAVLGEKLHAEWRRIHELRNQFGDAIWTRLESMNRTKDGKVIVVGIVPARYNERRELIRDRYETNIVAGIVNGLRICNKGEITYALEEIERIKRESKPSTKLFADILSSELKKITAALGNQPSLVKRIADLLELVPIFIGNDFTCLGFLVNEKAERRRLVQIGLELAGQEFTRNAADRWIASREANLLTVNKVEQLRIS